MAVVQEQREPTPHSGIGAEKSSNGGAVTATVSRITAVDLHDPEPSRSKTFATAWADLARGFGQHELWLQLGWQDIKQRYRRSVLGPLWITIATGVMAVALGLLYSVLFKIPVAQFLPHVTVGLIMWNFISGCIKEGSEVFIANEGLIKQLPSALSVHVYRLVWKQALFLLHNMVIWAILMLVFPRPLGWDVLLMFPALALLVINGVWVSMFFGIVATRYRDVAPLLEAGTQLLFYVTPIVWTTQTLYEQGGAVSERAKLAQLNPLYHYMEVVRAPMIGVDLPVYHWWVVIACTVVGILLALLAMRQWRFRVSYWV
ncbi:ABC transporter permease [Corynebacterium sp. 70RC1]|uniref:galactan export ABC transporter permease subunit Wzm/RfbD n=1 Tax=unclassified Corynebacterium TaxID=2624378 RepID=UPI0035933DB1